MYKKINIIILLLNLFALLKCSAFSRGSIVMTNRDTGEEKKCKIFKKQKKKYSKKNQKIYEWGKNFIKKRIFFKIYKLYKKLNYSINDYIIHNQKISNIDKTIKKNFKIALNELRYFVNGEYILKKEINWIKIKKLHNKNHFLLCNVKGFLNKFFSDWPIIRRINYRIKILVENYISNFIIKNNKNHFLLTREFIDENVKDYILYCLYKINKKIPKVIFGKNYYIKIAKCNINLTKKYTTMHQWDEAKNSISIAYTNIKKFLKTRYLSTNVFYLLTWENILDRIEMAKNLIDEYCLVVS